MSLLGDHQIETFKFIPLQNPAAFRQGSTLHAIRSHATRSSRRMKRLQEKKLQENFRVRTVQDMEKIILRESLSRTQHGSLFPTAQPDIQIIDPFEILPRSSSRLQQLMYNECTRQAGEPVLTVKSATPFRSSKDLYQSCLTNPAFLNALMLSLAFAENCNTMSVECWTYRGEAMRNIASLVQSYETAFDEITVGAILILTGVEYRFCGQNSHATHMSALAKIVRLEEAQGLRLSDSTKRSIFWQDLNGAVMSGGVRFFDHTTFSALYWSRTQAPGQIFILPPGLEKLRSLFCADIITVLEDLNGFRMLRDCEEWGNSSDHTLLTYIDNSQAWNESRIFNIQNQATSLSPLVRCCLTGAYICSYSLFSEIWDGTFIPSRLSTFLLQQLDECISKVADDHQKNLFLWLVYIGAAYSHDLKTRTGYVQMLLRLLETRPTRAGSWEETVAILRHFVWSDAVFLPRCHSFWTECQNAVA